MGSSEFVPGEEPNSSTRLRIAERWQGSGAPSWHFYRFTFSGKVPPKHNPLPDNPHAAGVRSGQAESSSAPSSYSTPALQPKQERGGRGRSPACSLCLLLPTSAQGSLPSPAPCSSAPRSQKEEFPSLISKPRHTPPVLFGENLGGLFVKSTPSLCSLLSPELDLAPKG